MVELFTSCIALLWCKRCVCVCVCVCVSKMKMFFFKHRNNQVSVSPTIFTFIKSMNILCLKNGNTQHGISGGRGS